MGTREPTQGLTGFTPPSARQMRRRLALVRRWFAPEFHGLDDYDPDRPALFVGNHTLYGLLDMPFMIEHLHSQHGVMLRGLGHRDHFNTPVWGDLLIHHGMVLGTRENCAALMEAGENILVFPGGAREVMRRRGENYQLIWKNRTGFARMAMKHGYDIIPFGSVGPDESFDILLDYNDVQESAIGKWAARRADLDKLTRNGEIIPPVVRGIGPTMIPRPQKFYFGFGERIPTAHLQGQEQNQEAVWQLREEVAGAVEDQIAGLLKHRRQDRKDNWSWLRRALAPLGEDAAESRALVTAT